MKIKFSFVSVLLILVTSNAFATLPDATFRKITSQGVPADALTRMEKFMDDFRGRSFTQSTYTCAGAPEGSVKPCDESLRTPTTSTVTLEDPDLVVIIDFSQPSTERRFFLINLKTGDVTRYYVSHGLGSGNSNYATKFSNIKDSKQTALGFYLTGSVYNGHYGKTLRMYGLQGSNDQAYNRDIVLHGAWYVGEEFINSINPHTGQKYGRLGVSWGCPAMSLSMAEKNIPKLKNGSLIMHYYGSLMDDAQSGNEVTAPTQAKQSK